MVDLVAFVQGFARQPLLRILVGAVFLVLFAYGYFRLTRGVGRWVFLGITLALVAIFTLFPAAQLLSFPLVIFFLLFVERRRGEGLVPFQSAVLWVEGGGIKRGLTPPEAAVLLAEPPAVVLATVLVGLLQKGFLTSHPATLRFTVAAAFRARDEPDPRRRATLRRRAAQKAGAVLHPYEEPFLEAFEARPGRSLADLGFSIPLKVLTKYTEDRARGHDLSQTQDYYRSLVRRAWRDCQGAPSPPPVSLIDHHLPWLALDARAPARFRDLWPDYRPPWRRETPRETEPWGFAAWLEAVFQAIGTDIAWNSPWEENRFEGPIQEGEG